MHSTSNKKWLTLAILCLGALMIVLDTTIVNVALPSIKASLGFSDTSLAWIVNAYMLTFGGFLLLGGRLGDIFGQRKFFLIGIGIFTAASLLCGLAHTQLFLIIARAIQGLGGALVASIALSLIMNLFTEPAERAKAMGVYGFVSAGGGSIGVLLGGIITSTLSWNWIFLVNIPVGIAVAILCLVLLPEYKDNQQKHHLDIAGAVTVTSALLLAVYAIINGNVVGWLSPQTLLMLGASVVLFMIFIFVESKVHSPLMPLHLFKKKTIAASNVIAMLWAAAMFSWFFLSALYLQLVLGYDPLHVGLSFLPGNTIMALLSLGISAKIVIKFGIKRPLAVGMGLVAVGLLLLSRAPVGGEYFIHVFPSMVLLGIGGGIAFNPLLLAAMSEVTPHESGLVSGMINTAFMMGGPLGLALLASVADSRTHHAIAVGMTHLKSLVSGYHASFIVGTCFAVLAAILALAFLPTYSDAPADASHGMM
jgi:EmrB/QacA subfamily drug resistance transporter